MMCGTIHTLKGVIERKSYRYIQRLFYIDSAVSSKAPMNASLKNFAALKLYIYKAYETFYTDESKTIRSSTETEVKMLLVLVNYRVDSEYSN